jgi:hypothetical protein
MSELNGRKVQKVQTHDVFLVDGLGNTKATLKAKMENTLTDSELTYIDGGVHVKGKSREGIKFEFLIPQSMCKVIQFVAE